MTNSLQGDGKAIFTFFIGAIIAIVFLASFADSIFTQTTTASSTNETVTVLAINTSLAVSGRELLVATSITNSTNFDLTNSGLSLATGTVNSLQTVTLTANDSASAFVGTLVNLTYTYNPDGYISIAGGRSIALLITIFSALAILVFAVVVFMKDGSLGALIRNSFGKSKKSNSFGRRK